MSQPVGASLQQCKRHRAGAAGCGADVLGDVFLAGIETCSDDVTVLWAVLGQAYVPCSPRVSPVLLPSSVPAGRARQGSSCSFHQDFHPLEGLSPTGVAWAGLTKVGLCATLYKTSWQSHHGLHRGWQVTRTAISTALTALMLIVL